MNEIVCYFIEPSKGIILITKTFSIPQQLIEELRQLNCMENLLLPDLFVHFGVANCHQWIQILLSVMVLSLDLLRLCLAMVNFNCFTRRFKLQAQLKLRVIKLIL
jgi:hypothetical protein